MRGSVMRRGKSWSYVVYLGRDVQGRKRQKWKGGFATKRAAEDALTELLERVRTGNCVNAGRMTVGDLLTEWLAVTTPRLRLSTAFSYTAVVTRTCRRGSGTSVWTSSARATSPSSTTTSPPTAARAAGVGCRPGR